MTKWNFKEMGTGLDHVVALVDVTESVGSTGFFVCMCVCVRVGVSDIRELLQKFQRDDHVEKLIKDLVYLQGGDLEEDVDQETDMMLGSVCDCVCAFFWAVLVPVCECVLACIRAIYDCFLEGMYATPEYRCQSFSRPFRQ